MDTALLVSLIGFAFISTGTPGPNNLLLMSSGALFGWRRTMPHLSGVLLGFAVINTSAVFGLGTVVDQWPWLLTLVRIGGASWLAWLSVRFFRAAFAHSSDGDKTETALISRPFRFMEAVFFQWINPKVIVTTLSAAGAYIAIAGLAWQRAIIIVSVFLVAGLITCSAWMIAGDALNRSMTTSRAAPFVNAAMGMLIVVTSLYILID
ncbi:MAG: LysE family translocator [Woeseia sp.]|nr:LysE family translocator [Woeseia sp.]